MNTVMTKWQSSQSRNFHIVFISIFLFLQLYEAMKLLQQLAVFWTKLQQLNGSVVGCSKWPSGQKQQVVVDNRQIGHFLASKLKVLFGLARYSQTLQPLLYLTAILTLAYCNLPSNTQPKILYLALQYHLWQPHRHTSQCQQSYIFD